MVADVFFQLRPPKLHYPFGRPPEGVDVLWRCNDKVYSCVIDAEREIYGTTDPRLEMCWHKVIRRTSKGAWIGYGILRERFVRLDARKRYACPTELEAMKSLLARRERQHSIYQSRANRAALVISMCKHLIGEG